MTSQPRQKNNSNRQTAINSRGKGSQAIKFSQLIKYNMRNIFLEKSYTKCGGKTILTPFSKKIEIEHMSGSIVKSFIKFTFIV